MKKCPQCEFIYEDDQSLCDMDGILLVFDSQQLPKPKYKSGESHKPKWRSRVVTGIAAAVLATVLLMVFYVSPNSQRPASTSYRPAGVNQSQPAEANVEAPAPKVEEKTEDKAPATRTEPSIKVKTVVTPKASPKSAQPKTTVQKTSKSVSSQNTAKKNDSKLGSLVKKTGKLLKKPFRF